MYLYYMYKEKPLFSIIFLRYAVRCTLLLYVSASLAVVEITILGSWDPGSHFFQLNEEEMKI